jgi:hypothetical protein
VGGGSEGRVRRRGFGWQKGLWVCHEQKMSRVASAHASFQEGRPGGAAVCQGVEATRMDWFGDGHGLTIDRDLLASGAGMRRQAALPDLSVEVLKGSARRNYLSFTLINRPPR